MVTLQDIRAIVTREANQTVVEQESIIAWCNDCNMDIGAVLNVPGTTYQIALNTTDLTYPLPLDLKEINRMWLQSDYDAGINRNLTLQYRIYNGHIEFPIAFPTLDTLNIDYYKFLTYFDDILDEIDFPDRYITLYTSYCKMRYYELPSTQQLMTIPVAQQNYELASNMYQMARNQVIQSYSFTNPDLSIVERW